MIDIEQVDISEALNHIVRIREWFKILDKAEAVLTAVQAAEQKAKVASAITDAADKRKTDVDTYVSHHTAQMSAKLHAHEQEMKQMKEQAERDAQAQSEEITSRLLRLKEESEARLQDLAQKTSLATSKLSILNTQVTAAQEKLETVSTQLAALKKAVA